jgi:hypothetical protein
MDKRKFIQGFTLTELLVGILFSTVTASAIISGSIYVKKTLGNIRHKELAYEKLKGHTEFWKGKISSKDIPSNLADCEKDVCLKELEINLSNEDQCIFYATELCYDMTSINTGISNARRWELITSIKWDNTNQGERELSFYVIQMEF